MNPQFVIDTIMERRHGIDMIARPYKQRTVYANPDLLPQDHARRASVHQLVGPEEPDVDWDSCYPEPMRSDRDLTIKHKPGMKPAEERMNIVANRIHTVDTIRNVSQRLESGLENGAMTLLKIDPDVVGIQTQFGPVRFQREGLWHYTYVDICADYRDGSRRLYAVRNLENAESVEDDLKLIRAQTLHLYAHTAELWTEKQISRAAVYRAERILEARAANNEVNNAIVLNALVDAGGKARLGKILLAVEGVEVAHAEDAVWSLIDRGIVVHAHPEASTLILKRHSWIRLVEKTK